ncbi:MAG: hypothetical protein KGQ60_19090, partial [Planctomycetes bacterium]|nr:hypothetical protein [Planctomycetota bacterium]
MENELPLVEPKSISGSCCRLNPLTIGILIGLGIATIWGVGFAIGRGTSKSTTWNGIPIEKVPAELLRASATHGSANLAVCTGQIDNDSEGFFALDFLTGDLKCWVYYPRQAAFGGMFYTNVMPQLGPISKNPEYLLVTGGASPAAVGSILRPAECLVYVVDARNG